MIMQVVRQLTTRLKKNGHFYDKSEKYKNSYKNLRIILFLDRRRTRQIES